LTSGSIGDNLLIRKRLQQPAYAEVKKPKKYGFTLFHG
jgi:hypothetical protein